MSAADGRRVITALGGFYIVVATGEAIRHAVAGSHLVEIISPLLLVGIPGLLTLYGGYRLRELDILPAFYPRIVAWTLGGFGLLLSIVGLRVFSPGVTIDTPLWSVMLATSLGTAAGLAIGMNEARALTQARKATQHSHALEQTKQDLEDTVAHLQTSNERLEHFAYAASHDLQEPLRMVSTYLQLLERRYAADLDEDAQEFIGFAVDGADRMRAMIDSLLAYSRITTRGEPMEQTDTNAILTAVLDDLQLRIDETDATITADDLPTVTADPEQLAHVFQNLLSNALTYSGADPPRVHVSAERSDAAWRFAVADEGIGIDPEYHTQIFDVFERLDTDSETSESGAGGIGLALCERILERHGGEIWVESDPGEGATFYFTLPRTTDHPDESATHLPTRSERTRDRSE